MNKYFTLIIFRTWLAMCCALKDTTLFDFSIFWLNCFKNVIKIHNNNKYTATKLHNNNYYTSKKNVAEINVMTFI